MHISVWILCPCVCMYTQAHIPCLVTMIGHLEVLLRCNQVSKMRSR